MKDITFREFESLLLNERHEAITEYSTHVAERALGDHTILLYQFDNFYAEVYFNTVTIAIDKITGFDDEQRLAPYLQLIDLSELK